MAKPTAPNDRSLEDMTLTQIRALLSDALASLHTLAPRLADATDVYRAYTAQDAAVRADVRRVLTAAARMGLELGVVTEQGSVQWRKATQPTRRLANNDAGLSLAAAYNPAAVITVQETIPEHVETVRSVDPGWLAEWTRTVLPRLEPINGDGGGWLDPTTGQLFDADAVTLEGGREGTSVVSVAEAKPLTLPQTQAQLRAAEMDRHPAAGQQPLATAHLKIVGA